MKIKVKNIFTKSEMAKFNNDDNKFHILFDVSTDFEYQEQQKIYNSEISMRIIFLNQQPEKNKDNNLFNYDDVFLDCEFSGYFDVICENDDTKIDIDKIMRTNCCAMLYPFIRERIARITQESLYKKPYYLESINFISVYNDWIKRMQG